MAAETAPSGLTFDQFEMGFRANLTAAAEAAVYADPTAQWDAKRSIVVLQAMSDADPDYHTALTDANPQSQEARHDDVSTRVVMALAGSTDLPSGPVSAEFEDLLNKSSLGPSIQSRKWY